MPIQQAAGLGGPGCQRFGNNQRPVLHSVCSVVGFATHRRRARVSVLTMNAMDSNAVPISADNVP